MALYQKTAQELIAVWDEGKPIWSLEMGGLGPGYEQAIQIAAVEFTRAGLKRESPLDPESTKDWVTWDEFCTSKLKDFDEKLSGITGVMYSMAKWLSFQWLYNGGPEKLIERAKERGADARVIQVSKTLPTIA